MAQAELTTGTGAKLIFHSSFQDSKPTFTATDGQDIPFIDESFSAEFDTLDVRHSQHRMPVDVQGGNLGRKNVSGDVSMYVDNDRIGYWLYALMGSYTAPTETAAPFTHTFTVGDTVPVLEYIFGYGTAGDSEYKHVWDTMISSGSFDYSDEMLQASFSHAGADMDPSETATPPTYSFPASNNWMHFKQAEVTITPYSDSDAGTLGTAFTASARSASLDYDNGTITDDFTLGKQTLNSIVAGEMSAEGNLELVYETEANLSNADLVSWFEGDEKAKVSIKYTRATGETLEFIIDNVWVTNQEIPMATQELIIRTVNWQAFNNDNSTFDIVKIVMENSTNSVDYSDTSV